MNIKTVLELQEKLDEELAWRKRELTHFDYLLLTVNDEHKVSTLLRSGYSTLYSHWEGFVKRSGSFFLNFITNQDISLDKISYCLITALIHKRLQPIIRTNKPSAINKITDIYFNLQHLNTTELQCIELQTESNLKSTPFKEIVWTLGFDYTPFEIDEQFIDTTLVDKRNKIAHGERLTISQQDFEQAKSKVIAMLEIFKDKIIESALHDKYTQ